MLHLVAVQVDQTSSPVRDHGRHLLIGLLHAFGERAAQGDKDVAKQLIGYLSDKSNDFVDQAVVTGDRQRRSLTMSKSLETLLRDTVAYFESVVPNLRQVWGELAIGWATSCPVRHVAVRSLQTFGILQPTFTQKMLSEILVRLSNIVADPNEEVQGFVLEILGMLDVITNGLESRQLAEIPQLFWAVHICLFTCNEQEYGVLLRIMKTLLMRLDMNDTTVDDVLCECIGRISDVPIPSLLLSIGRGLHSQSCAKLAFECWTILLDRHSKVLDQSPERWLFTMLYAVIPLAHAFCGEETMHTEAARFAGKLTVKLAESKLPDFARLFDSYSRGRIRAKDDLLKAFSLLVIDEFLKDHAARILGCTMGFLRNSDFQSETMELMRLLLVNARKEQLQAVLLNADLLRNLYQAFGSSAHFEEGLHVLHELMRVFTDTQESKVLMGSRAIQKLAREGGPPASFVQYTRWPYSETEMKQTRGLLSRLAAAYFVGRAAEQPTSADAAGDSSDSVVVKTGVGASGGWTADDDVAPAMELASEEEEAAFEQAPVLIDEDSADVDGGGPRPRSSTIIIDNYDELVNQLESLEDFFQVEGLHEEAGHGDFDDVVPKSSAETMNDSLYDDVGLMAGGTGAHAQLPLVVEPTYAENNSYDSDRYSSEGESDNVPSNSGDDYSDDNEDTFALESFLDKRLSTMTPENVRATAPDRAVLQISTPPRRLAEILEISQSPTTGKRSPTASDIEALSPRIVSSAASTKSPRVAESSIGQTVVMEQRPAAPLSAASETRGITPAIRSPSRPGSASPSSPRKVRFATQRDTLTALFDLPEVQNWDPCNQTTTDIAFIAATSHQSYNIYHGIFRHLLQLLRQHLLDTSGAADIEVCQMVLHVTKELRVSYESEPRVHFADANGEEIAEFTRKVMVIKEVHRSGWVGMFLNHCFIVIASTPQQHPKEYRSLVDDYHRLLRTFEERLLQCGELRQRVMKHDREVVAMYGRDASPVRSEQEKRREHQKFCVDLYELALSLLGVAGAVLDIQEMIDFVVMERANAVGVGAWDVARETLII